jgi:DNA-binding NarL/FixJ family response regulator
VLIVEDHELVRIGLQAMLENEPDIRIVGTAGTGKEALSMLPSARPDLVLLDYRLPDSNGAEICAEITRGWPETSVVILSSFLDDDVLFSCLAAGARGYLTKSTTNTELPDALRKVARGEAVLASETIERVMEWARAAKMRYQGVATLAPFEVEILRKMSAGMSAKEISADLRVSEDSVKTSVRSIKRRLGAADRAHAVALAMKRGII